MPPNLGGFFMVRSYYPSECHADYFDFERIEALKPAIERSEERFSRNAETDLVCRLLLEKKKTTPCRWTPLLLTVFLHFVVALPLTLLYTFLLLIFVILTFMFE